MAGANTWQPDQYKLAGVCTGKGGLSQLGTGCRKLRENSMPLPSIPTFHPIANPEAVVAGGNVRFTVLTDHLIRLEYSMENQFEDRPSQAFWHRYQPVPAFQKTIRDFSIEIETDF